MTQTARFASATVVLLATVSALGGCGRDRVFFDEPYAPPLGCLLQIAPSSVDLGLVEPGTPAMAQVTVSDIGGSPCQLSGVALTSSSDSAFSLPSSQPIATTIAPGQSTDVQLIFEVSQVNAPLVRKATLTFQSNDPQHAASQIPAVARIKTECHLTITPSAIDFGAVPNGASAEQAVQLQSTGTAPCQILQAALDPAGDSEFSLPDGSGQILTLQPGTSTTLPVSFTARATTAPALRTNTLSFETTDSSQPTVSIPLSATLQLCLLTVSPSALDFGNVNLNASATQSVTLVNTGNTTCTISGVGFAAGSDPEFTTSPVQSLVFGVSAGETAQLSVTFTASDSAPPHDKTGTLVFQTTDLNSPNQQIPLQAVIDTPCTAAGQFLYTVDVNGTFSRFDPSTLTYTDITTLACPTQFGGTPFSMNVDQLGTAWVVYNSGELFSVDTTTGACSATSYVSGQFGFNTFGMGSVFDPATGIDTLYLASSGNPTLGTLSFPGLLVTPIGPITIGSPELAGTGDNQLWAFVPANGFGGSGQATLAQLDQASAAVISATALPQINSSGGFAMKFHGGSFWIFIGADVWQVPRATLSPTLVLTSASRDIVGVGVSTCAPVN